MGFFHILPVCTVGFCSARVVVPLCPAAPAFTLWIRSAGIIESGCHAVCSLGVYARVPGVNECRCHALVVGVVAAGVFDTNGSCGLTCFPLPLPASSGEERVDTLGFGSCAKEKLSALLAGVKLFAARRLSPICFQEVHFFPFVFCFNVYPCCQVANWPFFSHAFLTNVIEKQCGDTLEQVAAEAWEGFDAAQMSPESMKARWDSKKQGWEPVQKSKEARKHTPLKKHRLFAASLKDRLGQTILHIALL